MSVTEIAPFIPKRVYQLAVVRWIDTGQSMAQSWSGEELIKSRAHELETQVDSVGYLIDQTSEYVLLAQNIDLESGNVAHVMRIERSAIKDLLQLVV